ncbi:PEP-CTERM sorting domain-containing protein [Persicirhabdus sediminis]|uniref:PEP-CTERM sorting domain-containing protein n=1 Tax=Persicirhabdus sediminis TaxID=454144 RepID=A0A8J7SK91_9BACT|nr:PEP-CTERM sorting domain-containing protein [Persicirhabdus sediminis]MBK1789648.1 PEP-CTERM sorting domain-containing protein [Persicirhabdus sediminis]
MKFALKNLLVGFVFITTLTTLNAAMVTFKIYNAEEDPYNTNPKYSGIADSKDKPMEEGSGVIGIGYFGIADDEIEDKETTIKTLAEHFHQVGETSAFGYDGETARDGNPGLYNFTTEQDITKGDGFYGKSIYLFIGNGSTFESSSEVLIYKYRASVFHDQAGSTLDLSEYSVDEENTVGELLVGEQKYISDLNYGYGQSFQLEARDSVNPIPEPTSMSLLALGGIALIRRRRG